MLSEELNARLTQTGKAAPAGKLMRQYWQPAALADELAGPRPVVPVRLLGEELVLFKSEDGTLGLIGKHCPHRGVDLCYGRLEHGGLRCPFHGWLFDHDGRCLEQPAEPKESRMHENIKHTAYPVKERAGIIWAFMGEGEPPAFPEFDCFEAPDTHVFSFKGFIECNWLQALEVGIDPAHASFLHRFLQDEDPADSYGKQFRATSSGADKPMTQILREYPRPEIQVQETDYGLRLIALRNLDNQGMHVRITNQVFPHGISIPMSPEMTITQWHVPVDDENCYWYATFTSFTGPVDKEKMRAQRLKLYELPSYRPKINKRNNYGFNPNEQRKETYLGMGLDINVHDQWAVESPGALQDRTNEHLGKSDVGIIAYRRLLRRAIDAAESGGELPALGGNGNLRGPVAFDTIAQLDNWQDEWKARELERRETSGWARSPW
ncbi:MAG: Rieske 2Fe-2S domain-containing protein [Hyphomicrobiales bacterium]